jgi:hypothetical protein
MLQDIASPLMAKKLAVITTKATEDDDYDDDNEAREDAEANEDVEEMCINNIKETEAYKEDSRKE